MMDDLDPAARLAQIGTLYHRPAMAARIRAARRRIARNMAVAANDRDGPVLVSTPTGRAED